MPSQTSAYPPVERVRVRHDAAVGRLRVERGAAEAAAAPAEPAEVGEQVEVLEGDLERLHAAHREPRHRPGLAVRDGAIGRVDHRDQVLDHHLLERAEHPAEVGPRGRSGVLPGRGRRRRRRTGCGGRVAGPTRIAPLHDDDHRPGFPLGDQVVHDEGHVPLPRPARLVLAAAVLEVQDGIAHLGVVVVTGRGVDEGATPLLGRLRVVPALPDLAVRNVLREIEVDPLLGDLDAAGVLARAVERVARRVVDLGAVDEHPIVVEPRHLGIGGRGPEAILVLRRRVPLGSEEPELDLLGIGCLDPERHPQVGVDLGIRLALDVGGRGDGVGRLRNPGPGRVARPGGGTAGQRATCGSSVDLPCWWNRTSAEMDDHSNPSTVAARTIGAVRSDPFTSSMPAITSFFPGVTVR